MTQYPELFAALAAPFDPSEVKNRSQAGRQMSYITSRTAMNRFDAAVGPENWRNHTRVEHLADGTDLVVCTIELRIGNEWIGKEDAGGFREMTEKNRSGEVVEDEENTVKTGYSDAFKRTAILWGVGRYLYRDGVPNYGTEQPAQEQYRAPEPQQRRQAPPQRQPSQGNGSSVPAQDAGRDFFRWVKDQEKKGCVGLLDSLNDWAKGHKFPGLMVTWSAEQVALARKEAERRTASASVHVQREPGSDDDQPY